MRTVLVVNPRSGAGRTGRRLDLLRALATEALGEVELRATEGVGDGRRVAREAASAGAGLVVAVGGDGTASEVVSGIVEAGGGAAFGLVPAGTGSDLARTLQAPRDWAAALAGIRDARGVPTDVIEVRFTGPDGAAVERVGINVVGLGMAGEVVARVNQGGKRLGGRVTFLASTLGAMLGWRPPEVALTWVDEHGAPGRWTGPIMNVFACNGSYCGGGMCVGPQASMRDGLLDVVVIPAMPILSLLRRTPNLYDGSLTSVPDVLGFRARRLQATVLAGAQVPCDLDGEQPGFLPGEVTCRPGALLVRAPWRGVEVAA